MRKCAIFSLLSHCRFVCNIVTYIVKNSKKQRTCRQKRRDKSAFWKTSLQTFMNHVGYRIWGKDVLFIFLSLSLLSLSWFLSLSVLFPYSSSLSLPLRIALWLLGQPPPPINSHHQLPGTPSSSKSYRKWIQCELNAMSKYGSRVMKGNHECLAETTTTDFKKLSSSYYNTIAI